ncbi:unnamed protein product [Ectocarpus sp. 8 AP-2014]
MHEKQELTCTVNEPTGTMSSNFGFRLNMFRRDTFVEARGTLQDLRHHLETMLASAHQKHVRVQVTSAFGQRSLCGPRGNKVMIEFSRTNGAPPELKISDYVGVSHVSIRQVTKAVDSVSYVGQGRYVIEYTPVLAGNFSAEVLVAGAMIPPSGSMGDVTILPSFAGLRGKLRVDESAFVGPGGPSKAFSDFTERVGQPGHLGAQGMVRTHQFFDDDVQLAGVFVLPGTERVCVHDHLS